MTHSSSKKKSQICLRLAKTEDVSQLVDLEEKSFNGDKLSSRNFRHLILKGNASTLVAEEAGAFLGYVTVLFRENLAMARIYSIAVSMHARGKGVGRVLAQGAEKEALDKGCTLIRLEIRQDNEASLKLFHGLDYRDFGFYPGYYEDGEPAVRLQKSLRPHENPLIRQKKIPLYLQNLEFTCGPSALMMAMHAHEPKLKMNIEEEINLWRESTTIFMTSGHGGCGPHGLALAALKRKFKVRLWVSPRGVFFTDSVRQVHKKEIIEVVQKSFEKELKSYQRVLEHRKFGISDLKKEMKKGAIPVVLISSWRLYQERFPHWVTLTGIGDRFVYFHDSWLDPERPEMTAADLADIPVSIKEFEKMCRYGSNDQRAAVLVYPKGNM